MSSQTRELIIKLVRYQTLICHRQRVQKSTWFSHEPEYMVNFWSWKEMDDCCGWLSPLQNRSVQLGSRAVL